jgi:hypothetical protein
MCVYVRRARAPSSRSSLRRPAGRQAEQRRPPLRLINVSSRRAGAARKEICMTSPSARGLVVGRGNRGWCEHARPARLAG